MRRIRRAAALLTLALTATAACSPAGPEPAPGARTGDPAPAPAPVAATATPDRSRPGEQPFDTSARSTTDPTSIWVVVNKVHPVRPAGFRPEISLVRGYQVARAAAAPLARLLDDADQEGLGFKIASAFRSYEYQETVHDDLVASRGEEEADRVSARPGFSEHQTGLAADLVTPLTPSCDLDPCFAHTAGGRWLAEHAWQYGFIVRYTAGNEAVTGYAPEPWHLRFVGKPLAAAMRAAGVTTLEEFLHVTGGDYG